MRTQAPLTPPSDPEQAEIRSAPAERESSVALLAAEAFSLVVRSCSTRRGVRALADMAGGDAELVATAAQRCGEVDALDPRMQQAAARLLQQTARRMSEQS